MNKAIQPTQHFRICTLFVALIFIYHLSTAQHTSGKIPIIVVEKGNEQKAFPIVTTSKVPAAIRYDDADHKGVIRAIKDLQSDIEKVTDTKPRLITNEADTGYEIIIGTLGKSKLVDQLAQNKMLNLTAIKNKWESFVITTISAPNPISSKKILLITGSDKRGTIYGIYELSRQMGVSPWYWWADVPVKKRNDIYVLPGSYSSGEPAVKYRGIFINDEEPALGNWAREKFGGINSKMYAHMFELILRLRGNYLWPAMWGKAFNEDDPENPHLADEYGIVMGTSHHEPMMRAQKEWGTHKKEYGNAAWNYHTNKNGLLKFWEDGFKRNKDFDNMVTLGMRGDGDEPMHDLGSAEANFRLLEDIIRDQRKSIEQISGKPASETPQMWALYKEVQEYYDRGMQAPDDVTLLLCDDNWGNIRRLPKIGSKPRSGGYGIYYHFDYVGGPRNYKWINTNNIARIWEQMHLAYQHGVDKIWIVNVGDLKPMEFPISFFLDYAYNPAAWNEQNLPSYFTQWAADQFGPTYAKSIGDILQKYTLYASRRKPELLDANTYSLTNFNEFERVVMEWQTLREQAEKISSTIPKEYADAYFQLVLHPVQAFENLHQLYFSVAKNKYYISKADKQANYWANRTAQHYHFDSLLTIQYNTVLSNGKWNHMMDQVHIGYKSWQEPRKNMMPAVTYIGDGTFDTPDKKTGSVIHNTTGKKSTRQFIEKDQSVSMLAANYTKAVNNKQLTWAVIPNIGRTGDGITTFPVTKFATLSTNSPHLQYEIYTTSKDSLTLLSYFSPTLNFKSGVDGLQFAVSIDNAPPQIIGLNKEDNTGIWNTWAGNNIIIKSSKHFIDKPGKHIVKYWAIDPGIVLQKLVVNFGKEKQSYLGAPETIK